MPSLKPNSRLGPYEILAPIGAGGMGQVHRALDTRLNRTVAIKVLPPEFSDHPEMKQRFEREAQTLASLSHPHICLVFDIGQQDGIDYLVMEFLEGQTLDQRLGNGAMPVDEALKVAIQIADALDKAHRQGIVHRDLKPSNVMLTKSGAKLLDFGLAKLKQSEPPTALSALPTNANLTGQGVILGTLQYMSPEQLEGKEADSRTDIFGFGALVYEMVTGRKAFEGKSQVSLMGAILERDPVPILTLQPATPAVLDRVIRRCLAKDPDQRWQSATDLMAQLEWLAEPAAEAAAPSKTSVPRAAAERSVKRWRTAAIVFFVMLLAASAALFYSRFSPAESESVRFIVLPPEKNRFDSSMGSVSGFNSGSISPDGRKLAFTARDSSGKVMLWVRPLETLAAEALKGTDGAALPFWSPNSRSLGFFADGKLKRIDANGGPVQTLSESAVARGATWNRQDVIVFAQPQGTLYRVSAAGGAAIVVTSLAPQQRALRFPSFLPDGEHFMYIALGSNEAAGLFVSNLKGDPPRRIGAPDWANTASSAVYSLAGYLLFARQGVLMAQPFDLNALQLSGQPAPIADSVTHLQGVAPFSVSDNGTLVYRTGIGSESTQMAWFDRTGKLIQKIGKPAGYISPSVAPDGQTLAVHRHDGNGGDVWLVDGETFKRFTLDASQDNSNPVWSPDGKTIAFGSHRHDKWGIYQKPSNQTGDEVLLIESDSLSMPMSWSPDGKYLVYYVQDTKTGTDLWALPLTGDKKPLPIVQAAGDQNHGQISPDGKWIAFNSVETGQLQIYVTAFPSGAGKRQVSTTSGIFPRWRRDGHELFFMETSDAGRMMSVEVKSSGDSIDFTPPLALFDSGYVNISHPANYLTWDISPDGQRLLIPRPEGAQTTDAANDTPITVVLNWTALLRHK